MNNRDLLKAIGDIEDKYLIEENYIGEKSRVRSKIKVNMLNILIINIQVEYRKFQKTIL